jgi:hypothetical protein
VSARKTQRDRILGLLVLARGGWVGLPEIAACACQYGARLWELRKLGFAIENKIRNVGGVRHSWFRLIPSQQAKAIPSAFRETSTPGPGAPAVQELLLDWHRDD